MTRCTSRRRLPSNHDVRAARSGAGCQAIMTSRGVCIVLQLNFVTSFAWAIDVPVLPPIPIPLSVTAALVSVIPSPLVPILVSSPVIPIPFTVSVPPTRTPAPTPLAPPIVVIARLALAALIPTVTRAPVIAPIPLILVTPSFLVEPSFPTFIPVSASFSVSVPAFPIAPSSGAATRTERRGIGRSAYSRRCASRESILVVDVVVGAVWNVSLTSFMNGVWAHLCANADRHLIPSSASIPHGGMIALTVPASCGGRSNVPDTGASSRSCRRAPSALTGILIREMGILGPRHLKDQPSSARWTSFY